MKVTAGALRNALQALRCMDVESFEALEARQDDDGLFFDEALGHDDSGYGRALALHVGVSALRSGKPLRSVLVWLYWLHGFPLREIGKRMGISPERARQLRELVLEEIWQGKDQAKKTSSK